MALPARTSAPGSKQTTHGLYTLNDESVQLGQSRVHDGFGQVHRSNTQRFWTARQGHPCQSRGVVCHLDRLRSHICNRKIELRFWDGHRRRSQDTARLPVGNHKINRTAHVMLCRDRLHKPRAPRCRCVEHLTNENPPSDSVQCNTPPQRYSCDSCNASTG